MQDTAPPTPHATPPHASFLQKLGPGGFATLMLAFASGLITLGIPLLLHRRRVLAAARGDVLRVSDAILVLGRRLEGNQLTDVFLKRLEHAAELWREGWAPRVIVTGGLTGKSTCSEAEVGRAWLCEHGIPEAAVLAEDRSQHTLDNLFNVRQYLQTNGWSSLILVSDPLHMARATAVARGLGLDVISSPAHSCPPQRGSIKWSARVIRESFLLHWYRTGVAYSRIIRSKRQLARIT